MQKTESFVLTVRSSPFSQKLISVLESVATITQELAEIETPSQAQALINKRPEELFNLLKVSEE